jgi:hypothetical protein
MIGCVVYNEPKPPQDDTDTSRFHAVRCTVPEEHGKSIANGAIEAQLIRIGSDGVEHWYSKQMVRVEKHRPTGGKRHALSAMVLYNGYYQSCHMLQNWVAYYLLAGFTHFYVYDISQERGIRWDFMPASVCVAGTITLIDHCPSHSMSAAALGDAGMADIVVMRC